jgi:hypothetical protein
VQRHLAFLPETLGRTVLLGPGVGRGEIAACPEPWAWLLAKARGPGS